MILTNGRMRLTIKNGSHLNVGLSWGVKCRKFYNEEGSDSLGGKSTTVWGDAVVVTKRFIHLKVE